MPTEPGTLEDPSGRLACHVTDPGPPDLHTGGAADPPDGPDRPHKERRCRPAPGGLVDCGAGSTDFIPEGSFGHKPLRMKRQAPASKPGRKGEENENEG